MSFTNQTTHYGLPQWIGSDKPTYLVDQNNAYQTIDSELYNANTASGEAVTTAQGAVTTAEGAASTAATALSTAQGAETTAQTADGKADNAITLAQSAQTAAGAAQTAAEAAQTAAAGNSITNLAPAYDPTQTYSVGDLVTQDGKLYQCITQVTTPEAFDINKWDDKTTSEVYQEKITDTLYALKGKYRYVIPANTHATLGDAYSWINSHLSDIVAAHASGTDVISDISIYDITAGVEVNQQVRQVYPLSAVITGAYISVTISATTIFANYLYIASSPTFRKSSITDSGTVTIADMTSTAQNSAIEIDYHVYQKL